MAVPVQHVPTLRALDPDVISVTGWVQLFNGYCALIRLPEEVPNAHGVIAPNERRRLFLQSVGDRAYEYLRTACLPNTPYCFPIHTLIRLLREKFEPPGLISTNRYQFHRRTQQQNESATEFVTALQVLAARCEFGLHYPEALRDQLIAGVRSNELRLAMLRENNLTFFQAKELAVRDDALRSEVRLMAQHSMNVNVANSQSASGKPKNKENFKKFTPSNKSNKKAQQPEASGSAPSWNPCFRCTRKHDGRTCPARNWECHKCKKKGHISKCCPKRQVQVVTAQPPDNAVVNTVGASLDDEVERLFRVSKESIQVICIDSVSQSPPVLVNVLINEKELEMEVDSGAGVSIVSSITYSKLFNSTPLSPSPYILTSVSGQIKVFGQLKVKVSLPSHAPVELILVVCEAVAPVRVQQLQSMFPSVFDLSNDQPITPFKAKLVFKENVKDIFAAAYSLPYALVDVIDALINNLHSGNELYRQGVWQWLHCHWVGNEWLIATVPTLKMSYRQCVCQVDYLGNIISKEGRKPSPDKIQAVIKARVPNTKRQVLSFLGLFTYYLPFLPTFSAVSKPLRELSDPIQWTPAAQSAFDQCKKLFMSSGILIHYNPQLPIILFSDASPDGLGAILCHKVGNAERPVAFASCALTTCQQNYAQIDREALGIMFAINKFQKYIWGRKFTLVTDNAPLKHILSPEKSIPVLSALLCCPV
ncbi:Retrovirus-related Pol polyprotein from transposon gypsy [Frankliniella fusca]|uniref:RNA-directed DNA polymerase n=1 Tax=Frankliniella fusca TaxID=407009 RepID=A0AAE1HF43_9NEOP|nr:Retrovirus-related Pol polyprotein from transposon gypsy [Frankliniella fusca]